MLLPRMGDPTHLTGHHGGVGPPERFVSPEPPHVISSASNAALVTRHVCVFLKRRVHFEVPVLFDFSWHQKLDECSIVKPTDHSMITTGRVRCEKLLPRVLSAVYNVDQSGKVVFCHAAWPSSTHLRVL